MGNQDVEYLVPELGARPGPGRGHRDDDFPGHDQAFQLYPAGRRQTSEPGPLRAEPEPVTDI
jgi:hypothetical protein